MKCEDLLQYLSDYLEEDLAENISEQIRVHVSCCHNCQVVLDTLRKTISIYHAHDGVVIPEVRRSALFQRLQNALDECEKSPKSI